MLVNAIVHAQVVCPFEYVFSEGRAISPFPKGIDDGAEGAVPGYLRDKLVKIPVSYDGDLLVVITHSVKKLFQLLDIFIGRLRRGEGRDFAFDETTGLYQLKPSDVTVDRPGQNAAPINDHNPKAMPYVHDAENLKGNKGFSQRRPADFVLGGEFAFCRQSIACDQSLVLNVSRYRVCKLPISFLMGGHSLFAFAFGSAVGHLCWFPDLYGESLKFEIPFKPLCGLRLQKRRWLDLLTHTKKRASAELHGVFQGSLSLKNLKIRHLRSDLIDGPGKVY